MKLHSLDLHLTCFLSALSFQLPVFNISSGFLHTAVKEKTRGPQTASLVPKPMIPNLDLLPD